MATQLVNSLVKEYPGEKDVIKSLRKEIFTKEDNNQQSKNTSRNIPKERRTKEKSETNKDVFFNSNSTQEGKNKINKRKVTSTKTEDDFFDNNSEKATKGKNKSKQHGVITNDDFDF